MTPKQFSIDKLNYRKEDGREIGGCGYGYSYAKNVGDDDGWSHVVENQVKEKNEMVRRMNAVQAIRDVANELILIKYNHPQIDAIAAKAAEIEAIMKANEMIDGPGFG